METLRRTDGLTGGLSAVNPKLSTPATQQSDAQGVGDEESLVLDVRPYSDGFQIPTSPGFPPEPPPHPSHDSASLPG